MKSKQLLSIVFSLIMFTGITAGNAVFAESDFIEDFEDCVEAGYPVMESFPEQCMTEDGQVFVNTDDDRDHGKYDLGDMLKRFCEATDEDKRQFFEEHPRLEQFSDRIANYCELSEDEQDDAFDAFVAEHKDEFRMLHEKDMADRYCKMSNEEKRDFISEHDKVAEHVKRMNAYCSLDDDARAAYIKEHKDDYKMNHENMRAMADKYCEMSNEEKRDLILKYDKAEEHIAKMNEYCDLDEELKDAFIADFKEKMKDNFSDYKSKHMSNVDDMKKSHESIRDHKAEYERYCQMSPEELSNSIDNPERLAKVTEWCGMTPEEREDYKKKYHDTEMDFKDKHMGALDRMKEKSDLSPRIKAMIMEKHDISDERLDEIKMKYREKHGDITDEQKSELKMKFKDHMALKRINMSDERKSEIHDRISEMKAFKAELRERASDMTEQEKQELRAQFIEKAKDMRLAWISPHHQMNVGISADEIECREGHSLVMKKSNGVPMCLKSDTALVMIERGIAVPA